MEILYACDLQVRALSLAAAPGVVGFVAPVGFTVAFAQRERQLQQQKKRKEGQLQSAHLRKMRRAAMLGNSAQELLIREGSGSIPWGVVVLGSCCVFLVLWVMFIKGFKGSLHKLKTVALTKKSSHVI